MAEKKNAYQWYYVTGEANSQKLEFKNTGKGSKKIKLKLMSFKGNQSEGKFSRSFTEFWEECNDLLQT